MAADQFHFFRTTTTSSHTFTVGRGVAEDGVMFQPRVPQADFLI
jgi:hypothetical protein